VLISILSYKCVTMAEIKKGLRYANPFPSMLPLLDLNQRPSD